MPAHAALTRGQCRHGEGTEIQMTTATALKPSVPKQLPPPNSDFYRFAETLSADELASQWRPNSRKACLLTGDRVQLQQVVLNLIINALQAMGAVSQGNRQVLITTRQIELNDLYIGIQDTGPGPSPGDPLASL